MTIESKQQILVRKQVELPDKKVHTEVGQQSAFISKNKEKTERIDKRGELKDTVQFVTIELVEEEQTEDIEQSQSTTRTKV